MKLILAFGGGGNSYYPYTQKPVDYQPYRPVYLFRGPPPDAGFSYGLFEDEETGKKYYADLGLDSFSPLSGKSSKLLEELTPKEIENLLGDDLKKENLQENECKYCGSKYFDNFHLTLKGRDDFFCHHCGANFKLNSSQKPTSSTVEKEEQKEQEIDAMTKTSKDISKDPSIKHFIENSMYILNNSTQAKELRERLANRYNLSPDKVQHAMLIALKNAIR